MLPNQVAIGKFGSKQTTSIVSILLLLSQTCSSIDVSQQYSQSKDFIHEPRSFLEQHSTEFQLADFANEQHESGTKSLQEPDYYYPDQAPSNHLNHDGSMYNGLSNSNRLPDKENLNRELATKACRLDRGCQRKDRLNNTFLSYCSRYKLENLLSNEVLMSIMHDSSEECNKVLDEFIQLDELIDHFDRLFKNLLSRYNCHNGYSVKWSCEDCKKAYKDWLCATNLPYYMNGERIKPCISFCERVEQRCPYLHPITKEQYGGQPVFICRDPNIPFVPEITPDIPYSEPTKCYDLCHLSDNLTELITDSLSKYDYDKCPDKGSIAEEVRGDPLYCHLDVQASLSNRSKTSPDEQILDSNSPTDFQSSDETTILNNITTSNKHKNKGPGKTVNVHNKKLSELREVLTIYKSQPKTHKFGHHSDHSSIQSSVSKSQSNWIS